MSDESPSIFSLPEVGPRSYPGAIAPWRRQASKIFERFINGLTDWLLLHWLGLINWFLGIILLGALVTPILAYFDVQPLAGWLFHAYHSICEQVPSHSFFILGHQVALCARNGSLYLSLWLGSMIFRFARSHLSPLKWWWLILFLLPMAIDGTTQLFGLRESNVTLRIITGTLFGFGICWFALPFVQEAIDELMPTPIPQPAK